MLLSVRLETRAPGQGVFRFSGIEVPGAALALAVQRNLDDKYLGEGQVWQTTPHWHRLTGICREGGEQTASVGPEILDPVAAASNMALRVLVRTDAGEASGILRIKGHLLGSPAAREPDAAMPPVDFAPEPDLGLELDLEFPGETRGPPPELAAEGGRSRGLTAGLFILVLAAAGIGSWHLGWLDQWVPSDISDLRPETPAPEDQSQGAANPDAIAEPVQNLPARASSAYPAELRDVRNGEALRGVELARAFLETKPTPGAIQSEAERQEQAGDCDAAMVLYNRAAQTEPRLASAFAGLLDPQGFDRRGCIEAPDKTAATLWYRAAAEADDTSAMRRLGQLLIERETSGPLFEDGVRWLRRAAHAGDPEARAILAKMKSPSKSSPP